jgi:hypothetical protein
MLQIDARRLKTKVLQYLSPHTPGNRIEQRPKSRGKFPLMLGKEHFQPPLDGYYTLKDHFFPEIGTIPNVRGLSSTREHRHMQISEINGSKISSRA